MDKGTEGGWVCHCMSSVVSGLHWKQRVPSEANNDQSIFSGTDGAHSEISVKPNEGMLLYSPFASEYRILHIVEWRTHLVILQEFLRSCYSLFT